MPLLFAATLFVSASLLFMVQPMVGKMVLPLLGGSPAVWNACMVFFQLLLLLGYQYSHFVTGKYSPRKQWGIHLLVLALPMSAFALAVTLGGRHSPIAIAEALAPSDESSPVLSVLALLTVAIGIPFFVIATSAPLLQKWFTFTGHPSARDPYFLYAASNLGSMISLLGYPLFIEPFLSIAGQAWLFAGGFVILAVMIFFCGRAAANPIGMPPAQSPGNKGNGRGANAGQGQAGSTPAPVTEPPPSMPRKLKWIALAFVPSSLMLGVTFHMTTDIASIPLLWVGPLALYLLTFIIAFGRVPDWFRVVIGNLAPVMILLLVFVMISGVNPGVGITLLLHMLTFFATALMCHYELARDRPSPTYLTEFFLLMSVGGVLGGVFNSLLAPLVFRHAFEYPIVLIIACLLVPKLTDDVKDAPAESDKARKIKLSLDIVIPIIMGVAFYFLWSLRQQTWFAKTCSNIAESLNLPATTIMIIFVYAVPVMLCFFFVDRPLRFALCVAAILGYSKYRETYVDLAGELIHTERSFFGILKVEHEEDYQRPVFKTDDGTRIPSGKIEYNKLVHGTTLHGQQIRKLDNNVCDMFQALTALNPWDNIAVAGANHAFNALEEPLTYYHRSGPVGMMFSELRTRKNGVDAKAPFAMVGLGTGSASCYVLPGQQLTFYEIDPAVKHLVADTDKYFSYVTDGRNRARKMEGGDLEIHMGDARLVLKKDTDRKYALLLVDAFSSDSIPIHLLTVEAVQLYLDRLTDDGILALHISNKFVKLEPVVSAIANKLGLTARVWNDDIERRYPGKTMSSWVVLARKPEHLGRMFTPLGDLPFDWTLDDKGNDRQRYHDYPTSEGRYYRHLMDLPIIYTVVADYSDELDDTTGRSQARYHDLNEADNARAAWLSWTERKYADLCDPDGSQRHTVLKAASGDGIFGGYSSAYRAWFDEKFSHPDTAEKTRLKTLIGLIRKYGTTPTLQDVMMFENGHAFRRLETLTQVHAWTDDYSDVMRVMMIPELQAVRKFFGLPTPIER